MKQQVIACVLALVFIGLAYSAEGEGGRLPPSVTVVGSGEASVRPDMAWFQAGVVTQAKTAEEALKSNNEAMAGLMEALAARGIEEKDIQTSNISINPQYPHTPTGGQPQIIGYQAHNTVRVKVRQLASLGAVLDDVVRKGSNQVHGIGFTVAEPERVLDQARRKALADAKRKADLYAAAAAVKIGRVLYIQEQTPHVMPRAEMNFQPRAMAAAVPVAAGEQEYRASITVTYLIE
jgi:uncharacterized protein YggE